MTNSAILEGFVGHLGEFAMGQSPSVTVVNRNIGSVPPSTGMWLEYDFFPSRKERLSWGDNECKLLTGYFQIGVGFRFDDGLLLAQYLADQVCEHFSDGTVAGPVQVQDCSSERPVVNYEDSTQNIIPVRAYYRGLAR